MKFFLKNICIIQIIISSAFSQSLIESNILTFPKNKIITEIQKFSNIESLSNTGMFNLSFHSDFAFNSGHSNIDNHAEFFAAGRSNFMKSLRLTYQNKWLFFEIEPYQIKREGIFKGFKAQNSFNFVNNNTNGNDKLKPNQTGLKQSQVIIHYRGFGIGYGNINQWWGEGFHSSISLTSNSPSQKTFTLGTFKSIKIRNFEFFSKLVAIPYKNYEDEEIYLTGLRFKLSYLTDPVISIGFNRFYLSGNFDNYEQFSSLTDPWDFKDAISLVFEPLFGQSKKNLDYTIPNTPGFDVWDETLAGNIKLVFPEDNLELYLELVSDDSRSNFTDLSSHWDHTLGYTIGLKKLSKLQQNSVFIGLEYLSTKPSNTFKKEFYRGDGYEINYFTRGMYNHFTYNTRFMGPHSGSSSDDFIFTLGLARARKVFLISYNIERHGLKSFLHPELKREVSILIDYNLSKRDKIFINLEVEKIRNFSFQSNSLSKSNMIWIGYSHFFDLK